MRAPGSARAARPVEQPPPSAPQASDVFSEQVLERCVVQHRFSQQLLQPPVLILQRLQAARLGHLEPAVLRFPFVEGRARDPVAAAYFLGLRPRLMLAQHPDDLFLAESAAFHLSVSFQSTDSTSILLGARGAGQAPPTLTESSSGRESHYYSVLKHEVTTLLEVSAL